MKTKYAIRYVLISLITVTSCSEKNTEKPLNESFTEAEVNKPVSVKTVVVNEKDFHYELLSNGTINAMRKADLRFQSNEIISKIYVKNGTWVNKDQVIAELDKFKLEHSLWQALDAKEKATLELQDVLIGQGYTLKDSASIPPQVMKIAKIRSNYDNSSNNYKVARYNLDMATLRAPFSGIVANLNVKEYNNASSEIFCTVIDNRNPEVVFNILENEISLVSLKDKVIVSPFSDPNYIAEGIISEINPIIDKNGMIRIKAVISNKDNKFYEGMNVKVRVQRLLGKRISVPKSAVVLRTNRKVIFTVKNGKSFWNYVETAQENSDSYVVTDGINVGDSVIYAGNFNLAHENFIIINNK